MALPVPLPPSFPGPPQTYNQQGRGFPAPVSQPLLPRGAPLSQRSNLQPTLGVVRLRHAPACISGRPGLSSGHVRALQRTSSNQIRRIIGHQVRIDASGPSITTKPSSTLARRFCEVVRVTRVGRWVSCFLAFYFVACRTVCASRVSCLGHPRMMTAVVVLYFGTPSLLRHTFLLCSCPASGKKRATVSLHCALTPP